MNPAADPLAQLRDIHLPDGVPWWPPAPGWWLLIFVLACLAAGIWWQRRKRAQRRRYRVLALVELEHKLTEYREHGQYQIYAREVSELLKRVALLAYPQDDVASLSGVQWVAFLSRQSDGINTSLPPQALDDTLYQKRVHGDAASLHAFATDWIEYHQEQRHA